MSYSAFRLTDGTTTQSLIGPGVYLDEAGGPPKIARLGEFTLGQIGPYQDAEFELAINITSAGATTTVAILRTLNTFLEQARQWNDGEPGVAAVRLEAQITGSAVGLLEAVVLDGELLLPDDYHDLFVIGEVNGATLRLTARIFLAAQETAVNSSVTNVGDIFTITLGSSHPLLSPIRLTWTAPTSARAPVTGPLIIARSSSDLGVMDAEVIGAGGAYSLVTPAGTAVARGTQVLRFTTPAGLREFRQVPFASLPAVLRTGPAMVDVWAVLSIDDADRLFQISFLYKSGNETGYRNSAVANIQGAPEGFPGVQAVYLSTMDVAEGGLDGLFIDIEGAAVGDVLDIDYFVFVIQKRTTFVIQPYVYATANLFGIGNAMRGVWDAAQTAAPDPVVAIERTTGSPRTAMSSLGDSWVGAQGNTIAGVWMAVDRDNSYRVASAAGGTNALSVTFTAQRRRTYPIPE